MIIGIGAGENFFASDVTALVSHTKNVIYLEDGEIAELTPEEVIIYDASGKPVEKKISRVAWDTEAAEKGGTKAARDVDQLVSEVIGLFAGGEIDEEEKDGIMAALNEAYWIAKKSNAKYSSKKSRGDGSHGTE